MDDEVQITRVVLSNGMEHWTPRAILGIRLDQSGVVMALLNWVDPDLPRQWHPLELVARNCPQLVISYLNRMAQTWYDLGFEAGLAAEPEEEPEEEPVGEQP